MAIALIFSQRVRSERLLGRGFQGAGILADPAAGPGGLQGGPFTSMGHQVHSRGQGSRCYRE